MGRRASPPTLLQAAATPAPIGLTNLEEHALGAFLNTLSDGTTRP